MAMDRTLRQLVSDVNERARDDSGYVLGRDFIDLESDGDATLTYENLVYNRVLTRHEIRELELNDTIRSFGDTWVGDEVSERTDSPMLALSWHTEVLQSKWTTKRGKEIVFRPSLEETIRLRDTMLANDQLVMIFDRLTTQWVREELVRIGVDGLVEWVEMINAPQYALDGPEDYESLRQQDRDRAEMLDESLRHYTHWRETMEEDRDKSFDHLNDRALYEERISRLHKEWKTRLIPEDEDAPTTPLLETIFGTYNGKEISARTLIDRVRSKTTHKEMGEMASLVINAETNGYVAWNWFWATYSSHWLEIEYVSHPTTQLAVEAVEKAGVLPQNIKVVDSTLMMMEGTTSTTSKSLRTFAKSLRSINFSSVVMLPRNRGSAATYEKRSEAMDVITELGYNFKRDTRAVRQQNGYGIATVGIYHIRNAETMVLFLNSKGLWVLYEAQ